MMRRIVIADLIRNPEGGVIPRGSGNPQDGRVAMHTHRHSGLDPESTGWGCQYDNTLAVIPRGSGNPHGGRVAMPCIVFTL